MPALDIRDAHGSHTWAMPARDVPAATGRPRDSWNRRHNLEETHGYPAGDNEVALADDETRAAVTLLTNHRPECVALLSLFAVIDSVSLPDIGNGYFIHPPSTVTAHLDEYGAVPLKNGDHGIVFGSDGGGNLFALAANGTVHKSRTASWNDEFYAVAASLRDFLEQLHDVIDQFAATGHPGAL